ncbi:hypothetical protein BDC45DRAFT_497151 [Circinella umbellata]|nr:hypothetical protein BDC45DRAFT_497151 [Circinella umbellata]
MHFTTTFTSIAACVLFIGATLTSFTIAIDQQQSSGNSLAYSAPEQNTVVARSLFTNQKIERRERLRMIKRMQEEPEEPDEDEKEADEGRSTDRTSQSSGNPTKNGGGDGKFIEQTADPAVHAVTKTGDGILGVSQLSNAQNGGSSASGGGHGGEEEERGSEA